MSVSSVWFKGGNTVWVYFGTRRIQISPCAEQGGKSSLCSERSRWDSGHQVMWAGGEPDGWQSCCLVGKSAWLCAFRSVSPRSAVALLQCAIQGTLLQERPGLVGTRPEKGHKGAKGIRRNDLWWGKVKRTKHLEPLSLLHGHRNSNGVSCASTEESWIKSLSFYIPIKVTRAEQNGCSSLWTLQKTFSCSWSSRCLISLPGYTLSLFKNHHRISMRLVEKSELVRFDLVCAAQP